MERRRLSPNEKELQLHMTKNKDYQTHDSLMNSNSDWEKLATMKDEDIDLSDIDELGDDFFQQATIHIPPNEKEPVTLR